MSTYTANLIKDADTTTPTSGTWTVPEVDDAIREIKRIVAYNEGVTAVSAYPATVAVTDTTLYCTGAGGTLNIPQLSTVSTTAYQKRIVVINDSSAALTFDPYSTETVGGASTYSIPAGAIAEFLGHGGTDWEIVRDTGKVFDGTALRSASATAAANTIPVSGSDSFLASGWGVRMDRLNPSLQTFFTESNSETIYTVGPTGSGATKIISQLDNVPVGSRFVVLYVYATTVHSSDATASCFTEVKFYYNDANNYVYGNVLSYASVSNEQNVSGATVIVPLDSNRIFKASWYLGKTVNSTHTASIYVTGYIK